MVAVDPVDFAVGHEGGVHQTGVDGAEGQGFEVEEAAELGFLRVGDGLVGGEVLNADAPFAGTVESGFDGGHHAFFHGVLRTGNGGAGDDLRAFVDVEEIAYAVACAVAVVALRLPQGFAADGVYHRREDVFGEYGLGKRDMGFEDEGVVAFLFGTRCADGDDAGDVGRTAFVLRAGVDEQEAVAADGAVAFGRCAVMRQGGVGVEARDGVETQ